MGNGVALELKTLRIRKGFTLVEVANNIGIDAASLSRYENNENSISVEKLEKLLNFYNEDISIFFKKVCETMHNEKEN